MLLRPLFSRAIQRGHFRAAALSYSKNAVQRRGLSSPSAAEQAGMRTTSSRTGCQGCCCLSKACFNAPQHVLNRVDVEWLLQKLSTSYPQLVGLRVEKPRLECVTCLPPLDMVLPAQGHPAGSGRMDGWQSGFAPRPPEPFAQLGMELELCAARPM